MHPLGLVLNYDERREFDNRETEHIHVSIYIIDAPRLDEDDETTGDQIVSSIDKYISCSISNEKTHPKLSSVVKEAQTHRM